MIDRFERFSFSILELSRYWHKITSDEMEKYGLKGPHSLYFVVMERYPEGLTAAQLCELCGKDKSDVSRTMALLEKKGLVKKEGVHQNLYRGVFKLTPEGKNFADLVCRKAACAVEAAGSDLTDDMRTQLYAALDLITERLKAMSQDGLPEES